MRKKFYFAFRMATNANRNTGSPVSMRNNVWNSKGEAHIVDRIRMSAKLDRMEDRLITLEAEAIKKHKDEKKIFHRTLK